MLFSYDECKKIYNSEYMIKKAVGDGVLYKICPGIYSDKETVPDTAIIRKKYPRAVFTLNSAFYFQRLTDTIPSHYYLITDKNAAKIHNKNIKQSFDNNNSLDLGLEYIVYNGDEIPVFSKERLLIELIRNKSNIPYDYYKEIINSYRRIINNINFSLVEKYAEELPKTRKVMETIQAEVF